MYLLLIVAAIFGYSYWRKKLEEKKWQMNVFKPEATRPYPHGYGESVMDYEYHLFDNFVKATWPRNFLSWECLDSGGICAHFVAPHHIMVHHTDGTYHDEVIRVTKRFAESDDEYGNFYKFEVRGMKIEKPEEKEDVQTIKTEPKPEPNKAEDTESVTTNEEEADIVSEWVKRNVGWMDKKISEGWFLVPYGDGENEVPENKKNEILTALEELFQVQLGEKGIEVYPAPDEF